MKIALTTDTFMEGKGGVSTAVAALARSLGKREHQVAIFTAEDPSHADLEFEIIGIKALKYEKFPGGRVPLAPTSLIKEISDFGPDIIHNHSLSSMGVQAITASKLLGIPIMGTCHVNLAGVLNYAPVNIEGLPLTKELAWQYTTTYFNRFPYITAPSKMMCNKMLEYGLSVPLEFISNGVDIDLFQPDNKAKDSDTPFTVVHVGRLSYEKQVDVVIRAFSIFRNNHPEVKLVIAGDGPENEPLTNLITELNLAESAEILGFVPHHELPALFNQSDLFTIASPIETQGLVALEAMACGLPVIGVNEMAIPDLISDGENGYVVETGDHEQMAARMVQIYLNPGLLGQMGKTSREMALNHSLDRSAEEYVRIYQKVIAEPITRLLPEIPSTQEIRDFFKGESEGLLDTGAVLIWDIFEYTQDLADKYITPLSHEIRKRMPNWPIRKK